MIAGRQRIGIALIVAAAALAGCAGAPGDGVRPMIAMDGTRMDLQDPVEEGRALLVTGQYGLAIDALSRVLHDQPGSVRALNLIAEAYDRLHRYDLADRYHAEALEIDPNSLAALNNWGFSYLVRGDKARAKGLLERAQGVKGDQPVVLANLRLATEGEQAASMDAAPTGPAVDGTVDVLISEHVTIVHRTGKLVRMAPGVQLLVTTSPIPPQEERISSAAPLGSAAAGIAPLAYGVTEQQPAGVDPRIRNLAALQRLLDPSPFGFFPDVDDFNLQWRAGMGSAASAGWSGGQTAYRLAS
jgi:tetratricopeptide (TPR) repeat protein